MRVSTGIRRAWTPVWVLAAPALAAAQSVRGADGGLGANVPGRAALAAKGVAYGLNHVGEWRANVAGGASLGGNYIGRLEGVLNLDLAKLAGWQGLNFHMNGYQIHGTGLSRD